MAEDGGMMAKSRLSQNPFAIKTTAPTRSLADSTDETRPLLAPPTLKWGNDVPCNVSSSSKIFLRPSALSAQTEKLKVTTTDSESNFKDGVGGSTVSSEGPDSSISSANPFLPPSKDDAVGSQAGFVFGQNLHERVVVNFGEAKKTEDKEGEPNELTFEAAANLKEPALTDGVGEENLEYNLAKPSKSLTESAEEYQSRQVKRKYSEVIVVTGEEEESNVIQMSCKLFLFNKVLGSWQERGRGILRLNDKEVDGVIKSRLVMRTHGSLRVVLNTKIWPGMTVEHPSQKSIRITALDSEGIKVYLIMASGKDSEQLFSALDWRVTMLKSRDERLNNSRPCEASNSNHHQNEVSDSTQGLNNNGAGNPGSPLPKRWRNCDGNTHSGDDQPESSTASGSISPGEADLSSDSGFPATEDS